MISLFTILLIPIKEGIAPIIKAKHVKPKENPGRPGKILERATSVTGIVMLNRNIPMIPSIGLLNPKINNGIESINVNVTVRIHPNLSAIIPPIPFPNKIAKVKRINKLISVFQGNTIKKPIRDLIAIDENIKRIGSSKLLNLVALISSLL